MVAVAWLEEMWNFFKSGRLEEGSHRRGVAQKRVRTEEGSHRRGVAQKRGRTEEGVAQKRSRTEEGSHRGGSLRRGVEHRGSIVTQQRTVLFQCMHGGTKMTFLLCHTMGYKLSAVDKLNYRLGIPFGYSYSHRYAKFWHGRSFFITRGLNEIYNTLNCAIRYLTYKDLGHIRPRSYIKSATCGLTTTYLRPVIIEIGNIKGN